MNQHKRIFIIGHPGAGKGLLAKSLAEKLGWEFIDADLGLEFRIGRTLPEIIGEQGQKALNDCTIEILNYLLSKENIVVSTDVSIVLDNRIIQLLSPEFVVNLKANITTQIARTIHTHTPLLPTELSGFFAKLHEERDNLFDNIATLSIDSDDNDLDGHVTKIINNLNGGTSAKDTLSPTLNEKELIYFHKILHTPIRLSYQQAASLKLLAQGKSSKEIARDLNISPRTVENYLAKTMEILGCTSSKELISLYYDKP